MAAAGILAAIFAGAVVAKHRSRTQFYEYLELVPVAMRRRLVPAILALEAGVALSLAVGAIAVDVARPAGVATAAFLMLATGFHGVRIARGFEPSCHCFGRPRGESDSVQRAWHPALFAARNATLTFAAMLVAGASPWLGFCVSLAAVLIIAAALLRSFANERTKLNLDSHPKTSEIAPTLATLQAHSWWVNGRPRPF